MVKAYVTRLFPAVFLNGKERNGSEDKNQADKQTQTGKRKLSIQGGDFLQQGSWESQDTETCS